LKKNQPSIDTDKLKGVLITRTAIKTLMPEDIVEKVIMFQFKDIKEAAYTHEQMEVSGFGKFLISNAKLKRKKEKLVRVLEGMAKKVKERPHEIPANRLAVWDKMTQDTQEQLEYLKTKKGGYENKYKGDTGGSMELPICQGGDREDSKAEE
jgi:nucleoid DNA-binding protein